MAFQVALYGKTAEGIELSDLVNRKADKNLEVHLPFTVTNDKNEVTSYLISRYYKHKKMKNKLILFKDGMDISSKTATETYKQIESILIPRSVFLNTVYFSQQVKDFFTALSDSKQKEIFEAILQLGEWEVYYKNASAQVKQKQVDIANIEGQRDQITARLPDKAAEIQRMEAEHDLKVKQVQDKLTELATEISGLENEIVELKKADSDLDDMVAEMTTMTESMATHSAEMKVLQEKKDTLHSDFLKKKEMETHQVELEYKTALQEAKEEIEAEAVKVKERFTSKLPELKDQLSKLQIDAAKKETELNQEFVNLQRKYDVATLQTERDNELDKLSTEKETLERTFATLKERHTSLKQDLMSLKDEIHSMSGDEKVCPTCNQKVHDAEAMAHFETEKQHKVDAFNEKKAVFTKVVDEFQELKVKHTEVSDQYDKGVVLYENKLTSMTLEKQNEVDLHTQKSDALQVATEQDKDAINVKIESIETEMDSQLQIYRDQFAAKKGKLSNIRSAKFSELNKTAVEQHDKELKDLKDSITSTFDTIQLLDKNKRELSIKIEAARSSARLLTEKSVLVSEKKHQYDQYKAIELDGSDIEAKKNELVELTKEVDKFNRDIAAEEEELEILKFWKNGFSDKGIPSMLIDEVIPFMNTNIKRELEKIAPGKYIVSFDTVSLTKGGDLRERFAVNILNVESGADNHKILSGGEKRQIDVCCMRVLRLLAEKLYQKSINVTFLDEVLDSLDSDNASIFCQHLKALSAGQNITLITHSMLQDAECDRVLGL
jgi:DNA repair exonuclease SbcCD ATPase subunit